LSKTGFSFMASLQVQVGKNPHFYYMDFILRIQQGNLVPAWIYVIHHPWCVPVESTADLPFMLFI